jgi:HD-GYP domain-containing protein (c-di-GMP phosphodiesterase class II)
MNGSGYPDGLSGENILPEVKILAVADVIDAIASHRPYRPALGLDKALAEIMRNKGLLYDNEVVDACFELLTEKDFMLWEDNQPECMAVGSEWGENAAMCLS